MIERLEKRAAQLENIPEPKQESMYQYYTSVMGIAGTLIRIAKDPPPKSLLHDEDSSLTECKRKIDDLEKIFGSPSILSSITGKHYVRSLHAMYLITSAIAEGKEQPPNEQLGLGSYSERLYQLAAKLENSLPQPSGNKIEVEVALMKGMIGMLVSIPESDITTAEKLNNLAVMEEKINSLSRQSHVFSEQLKLFQTMHGYR